MPTMAIGSATLGSGEVAPDSVGEESSCQPSELVSELGEEYETLCGAIVYTMRYYEVNDGLTPPILLLDDAESSSENLHMSCH